MWTKTNSEKEAVTHHAGGPEVARQRPRQNRQPAVKPFGRRQRRRTASRAQLSQSRRPGEHQHQQQYANQPNRRETTRTAEQPFAQIAGAQQVNGTAMRAASVRQGDTVPRQLVWTNGPVAEVSALRG